MSCCCLYSTLLPQAGRQLELRWRTSWDSHPSEDLSELRKQKYHCIAQWLEANRPNIAVTTYDQYCNILNNHIRPYFDPRRITVSKLTAGDLEDYYAFKIAGGLSPNSVIKHHAVIRTALQWAVKHRYIRENVADFAEKPSHVRYHGAEPYTIQEIAALLQATASEPIAVPIFLASFYGLRRSEVLGLRWSSIDFQNGVFSISTTVVREKHGDQIVAVVRDQTTKTESSMRTLPLCPFTYQYFSNLKQFQLYQQELCGNCYDMRYTDFLCVDQMGTLLQPDYITQKFQQILAKYGLRRIRFHDLRHPYVKHTTKIFSLRLKFFQAQQVPDALRKTRGAFLHLREGGSHNPFLRSCNKKLSSWSIPQSKMSLILYAISMRLSGYTSTLSTRRSVSSAVRPSELKTALAASCRLSRRACSSCFCFACANTTA